MKREHFNRWYGLNSYFLALTVSTIPIQTIFCTMYVALVYFLTDQPVEIDRIFMFFSICVITSFISESLGLMIASVLNVVVSSDKTIIRVRKKILEYIIYLNIKTENIYHITIQLLPVLLLTKLKRFKWGTILMLFNTQHLHLHVLYTVRRWLKLFPLLLKSCAV